MKNLILLSVILNINIVKAQFFFLQPNVGSYTFQFIGNGTSSSTSIVQGFNNFNNPYSSNQQFGLNLGIDIGYQLNKKNAVLLSAEFHSFNYKLYFNRTYNSDGFYRPTSGYLNTSTSSPQFYLQHSCSFLKFKNFEFKSNIGISYFFNASFKPLSTRQELYDGSLLSSINTNDASIRYLNYKSFCSRFGIVLSYNKFNTRLNYDLGIENLFRGDFKKNRNDFQSFIILPQAFNFTIGYKIMKK